jgi:hypothetical protein
MGLKTTQDLVEKTAKKLKISKFLVKEIINDCYSGLREELKNPNSPAILLHKLGTISVIPNTLKAHMHNRFTIYDNPEKLKTYVKLLNDSYKYKTNGKQKQIYKLEDFTRS